MYLSLYQIQIANDNRFIKTCLLWLFEEKKSPLILNFEMISSNSSQSSTPPPPRPFHFKRSGSVFCFGVTLCFTPVQVSSLGVEYSWNARQPEVQRVDAVLKVKWTKGLKSVDINLCFIYFYWRWQSYLKRG